MRALATALGLLLTGCTAVPEAEELVLAEEDDGAQMPSLRAIPDREAEATAPPQEPEPEPMPIPAGSTVRPRFVPGSAGVGDCWAVEAEGFPAISSDGTTIAVPDAEHLQLSYTPGSLTLRLVDVASGRTNETHAVLTGDESYDETDDGPCRRTAKSVRRHAARANAVLASGRWRAMERLPVSLVDPWTSHEAYQAHLDELDPADRIVQLGIRRGEVFVRIPGVKVLERDMLDPDQLSDPFAVYADRSTGTVVLVTTGCVGDSCTCDPRFTSQVLHWSPETFAAIDQRPCVDGEDDEALDDTAMCEAMDFGFNATPWSF